MTQISIPSSGLPVMPLSAGNVLVSLSSPETPPFVLNRSTGEWTRPEACSRNASAFILPQPLLLMSSAALLRQQEGTSRRSGILFFLDQDARHDGRNDFPE
ncbi:MAG: hypothetical protein H8D67_19230 [Deltaproteobacteria bacterium]|nr:hypothetical protein [Deltaproteobacteria bacterium]MBL7204292.1 hypothetical protein [Desulfobacteraceae bacterium]